MAHPKIHPAWEDFSANLATFERTCSQSVGFTSLRKLGMLERRAEGRSYGSSHEFRARARRNREPRIRAVAARRTPRRMAMESSLRGSERNAEGGINKWLQLTKYSTGRPHRFLEICLRIQESNTKYSLKRDSPIGKRNSPNKTRVLVHFLSDIVNKTRSTVLWW